MGLNDEREQYGLGSMNAAEYTVTNYDPSAKYFSMSVIYSMGAEGRQTVVNFVYNQTAHSPDFVWDNEIPDHHYVSDQYIFSRRNFINLKDSLLVILKVFSTVVGYNSFQEKIGYI